MSSSANLGRRIAFSVVAIPAVLAVLYLGGWPLVGLLAVFGAVGTWELFALARRQGIEPLSGLGLAGAVAMPVAWTDLPVAWVYIGAAWLIGVLAATLRARRPDQRPLASAAVTVLAPLYASGLLSFVMALRHGAGAPTSSWPGLWVAALPLILTWLCDTAAMAAGKLIGGPKLAPVVSPNKTWAGAIAGALVAVVGAIVYQAVVLSGWNVHLGVVPLAAVGLVVGVMGQAGDVVESLFKREVGAKDSSELIPGHGGVLDRLDSLYFVVPASALVYFAMTQT